MHSPALRDFYDLSTPPCDTTALWHRVTSQRIVLSASILVPVCTAQCKLKVTTMQVHRKSPWRIPLVRELAAILLIKLVLLLAIKHIWFDAPTVPLEGTAQVAAHLLSPVNTPPSPALEETPR